MFLLSSTSNDHHICSYYELSPFFLISMEYCGSSFSMFIFFMLWFLQYSNYHIKSIGAPMFLPLPTIIV